MLVSNKQRSKRKQSKLNSRGRQWAGKPSILENQHVQRRNKKSGWSGGSHTEFKSGMRSASSWGSEPKGGEWRTRFLEGGFVIAAGLSDVIKNGVGYLFSLVGVGQRGDDDSVVMPGKINLFDENGSILSDRVEPELEPGYDTDQNREWLQSSAEAQTDTTLVSPGEFLPLSVEQPLSNSDLLWDNIEWSKMNSQDQQEIGLGEDELEDQAGALRSMFSNRDTAS
ncbi:MAG: hypothetical protein HQL70_02215 [Magnetococcales bacterium]|nr:hypothetical protein [Magnetococcales bacterium]